VVNAVLDEGLLCHVGFTVDESPFVMPMAYARVGDTLYLHGATGNRILRHLADGAEVCITVTLLDALVLARSAFHHSMNFRSVVLFGTARPVSDDDEKNRAMVALVEHLAPGRSAHTRLPTPEELRATRMIRVPIEEGSAKVRSGGPIEEPSDMGSAVWAGEVPMRQVAGTAIPDADLLPGIATPAYVDTYPDRGALARRRADASGPARGRPHRSESAVCYHVATWSAPVDLSPPVAAGRIRFQFELAYLTRLESRDRLIF
jgi:hypothetical protein